MEARNINDIVKSASRSCQGRMQIIKCQSDLLLKIGVLVFRPLDFLLARKQTANRRNE
ncbi:Uncharacterised protein [Escherichia coli]|nr:Uncharacterised protein [Escherichia coli]